MPTGSTGYPGVIDVFEVIQAEAELVGPDVVDHAAALNAIEAELGINPSGASATVVERLDAIAAVLGVPNDGSVTLAKLAAAIKPSGSAAAADEAVRRLGTGATHAAAGDDARFPTTGQKNALAGTAGTPGTGNEYATKQSLDTKQDTSSAATQAELDAVEAAHDARLDSVESGRALKANLAFNVRDTAFGPTPNVIGTHGALGDGGDHFLLDFFVTLADAQVVYPFVTSLSETLDTAAITKALKRAYDEFGAAVYVPAGTGSYVVSSLAHNWSQPNAVHFFGDGPRATTLRQVTTATDPVIDFSADVASMAIYSSISDMRIYGNGKTNEAGIRLTRWARYTLANLIVDNHDVGYDLVGSQQASHYDCYFVLNNTGIRFEQSATGTVRANEHKFYGGSVGSNTKYGIDLDDCLQAFFYGAHIDANGASGDADSGAWIIRPTVDDEAGFAAIVFNGCQMEDNYNKTGQAYGGDLIIKGGTTVLAQAGKSARIYVDGARKLVFEDSCNLGTDAAIEVITPATVGRIDDTSRLTTVTLPGGTQIERVKQPLDSDLTAIAALTTTAYGRALLEKADAAAAKTALSLAKADVGLGSVDNTSDTAKPVSTAQQTALDLRQPYVNIDPLMHIASSVGAWVFTVVATSANCGYLIASGVQNEEVAWDVMLPQGTWTFSLRHRSGVVRGIYTILFDDVSKGTIDGYSASTVENVLSTVTGIVVPETKVVRVKLKMATKHASATNYYGAIIALGLLKTA